MTGAKGFIGSSLVPYFLDRGIGTLRVLERSLAPGQASDENVDVLLGDLLSPNDCSAFVTGLDVVYYLAHRNTPVNSDADFSSDSMLNSIPLLNLIQAIRNAGKKTHVVYFSSGGAVYGNSSDRIPFKETDPCVPVSSYGIQKLLAEQYLRLAAQQGILTATVLRVGNAYGKLLPSQRMQGLIGVVLSKLLHREQVVIFGNPNNVRDYIHVDDICSVCEKVIDPFEEFSVFNVANQAGYSVLEVIAIIEEVLGQPFERVLAHEDTRGQRLPDWCVLDTARARRALSWAPQVSLHEGIMKAVSATESIASPTKASR